MSLHPRTFPDSTVSRSGILFPVLAGLLLFLLAPSVATADEIVYRNAETCAEITVRAPEITSETWTKVMYREKTRGPEITIPAALVLRVNRDATTQDQKRLLNAIGELERGNLSEARRQLKIMSGGGYKQDLDSGQLVYMPFTANDPESSKRRPPWSREYAHFYYAKALYLEGKENKDTELLKQAYLALVDQKVPGGDGKQTTGGFLQRFSGGNSRFYPEAMLLAAESLVALDRYADAAKGYQALSDAALKVDMGPRWAYEAKLGPGRIAEAKGDDRKAYEAYVDTANYMKLIIGKEVRPCIRREIGRYFSLARTEAARVLLRQAEENKSPTEFLKLRNFIEESTPAALEKKFGSLPKAQRDALVQGALDSGVQAVMENGKGLAYLNDKLYEDAILAFRAVEVKYFQVPEEHARALHYLALAAEAAAGEARQDEARKLFESYRDGARRRLREEHPNSRWAK